MFHARFGAPLAPVGVSPIGQLFEELFRLRVHVHAPFHRRRRPWHVGEFGGLRKFIVYFGADGKCATSVASMK